MTKIAILNDWQNVALSSADWSVLPADAEITVFNEALPEGEATRAQPHRPQARSRLLRIVHP